MRFKRLSDLRSAKENGEPYSVRFHCWLRHDGRLIRELTLSSFKVLLRSDFDDVVSLVGQPNWRSLN